MTSAVPDPFAHRPRRTWRRVIVEAPVCLVDEVAGIVAGISGDGVEITMALPPAAPGPTERVIGYRAFCISRGEQANLPGFDENTYVANANGGTRPLAQHLAEWSLVREGNLVMLRSLDAAAARRIGTANGNPASVRAMAFVMVGHVRHHLNVLQTKYGIPG